MKKIDKKNIIRLIAVIIFIGIAITATILILPFINNIRTEEGRLAIQETVSNSGISGVFLFLGLQILQVVIALIPGEPIEIIGGILFGTFGGLFLCLIGLLLGTILVFYLVKAVGKPLIHAFVSEEKLNSFKFLNNQKKLETLIFILFLIPGTPKDTLTYIIPLTKIAPWKFFLLSTVARIPSVVTSTLAGNSIGEGNWLFSIIIFLITAAIGLVGIYFNNKLTNKLDKKKLI